MWTTFKREAKFVASFDFGPRKQDETRAADHVTKSKGVEVPKEVREAKVLKGALDGNLNGSANEITAGPDNDEDEVSVALSLVDSSTSGDDVIPVRWQRQDKSNKHGAMWQVK